MYNDPRFVAPAQQTDPRMRPRTAGGPLGFGMPFSDSDTGVRTASGPDRAALEKVPAGTPVLLRQDTNLYPFANGGGASLGTLPKGATVHYQGLGWRAGGHDWVKIQFASVEGYVWSDVINWLGKVPLAPLPIEPGFSDGLGDGHQYCAQNPGQKITWVSVLSAFQHTHFPSAEYRKGYLNGLNTGLKQGGCLTA